MLQYFFDYLDAEGDNITIFNALDFGIFQEQKINKIFVVKNVSAAPARAVHFQEKRNVTSAEPTASTASASASQRVLHPNVICDGCDKEIFGYRYKCLECADYDLCMECEPKLHNHHLMIRIADPNDAEICYKSKLGKRFLRHRRSGSLCSKSVEEEEKKHFRHPHHHKRHASGATGVRPPTVGDVLANMLHSFAGTSGANGNAQPSSNTESTNQPAATATAPAAAEKSQPKKTSASVGSTPAATPTGCPAYGFNIANANGKPHLKNGIDMLQNVAQNFAAMMDPFATFMEQSANAYASAASAASASSANASESASAAAANGNVAATASATVPVQTATETAEPMTGINVDQVSSEKVTDKEAQVIKDIMIVDCSDDEDEDLRRLVTALNVDRKSSDDAASTASKKDENSASIEAEKG